MQISHKINFVAPLVNMVQLITSKSRAFNLERVKEKKENNNKYYPKHKLFQIQ